jgi:hypothetical protein
MIENYEAEGWGQLGVVRKEDGAFMGRCGLLVWDTATWTATQVARSKGPVAVEVGYLLGREYWGKGYATEAAIAVRDWAFGTVMTYASGTPILAPTAVNNLNSLLFRGTTASAGTFYNRNPGVPLFLKDLNCHCIDPTKDLVLNTAAWSNPTDGQFGTANAYYNDYRYQRRPSESLSLGRVFSFKERMRFTVRMNFTNVLNRLEMSNPSGSPSTPSTKGSVPGVPACSAVNSCVTGGFGFINFASGATFLPSRQGTLEMRLSF